MKARLLFLVASLFSFARLAYRRECRRVFLPLPSGAAGVAAFGRLGHVFETRRVVVTAIRSHISTALRAYVHRGSAIECIPDGAVLEITH